MTDTLQTEKHKHWPKKEKWKSQEKITHLMYMDDIKLFTKNEIE